MRFAFARNPALVASISPFDFVATNRSFIKIFGNLLEHWEHLNIRRSARAGGVSLSEFQTRAAFRVELRPRRLNTPRAAGLAAARLVPIDEITLASVRALQQLHSDYLVRCVKSDGRMIYLYHPSRGSEDRSRNNAIRQWMATRSLIRIWQQRGSSELLQKVRKNVEYNLSTMYAGDGAMGVILDGKKVKLGAVALAALALAEAPFAADFAPVRDRLAATIDFLWQPDGACFALSTGPRSGTTARTSTPGEAALVLGQANHCNA